MISGSTFHFRLFLPCRLPPHLFWSRRKICSYNPSKHCAVMLWHCKLWSKPQVKLTFILTMFGVLLSRHSFALYRFRRRISFDDESFAEWCIDSVWCFLSFRGFRCTLCQRGRERAQRHRHLNPTFISLSLTHLIQSRREITPNISSTNSYSLQSLRVFGHSSKFEVCRQEI